MSSGPSVCLAIKGENAVRGVAELIGPKDPQVAKKTRPMSIRALYGDSIVRNAVDVSKTYDDALEKIMLIFPNATRNHSVADLKNKYEIRTIYFTFFRF